MKNIHLLPTEKPSRLTKPGGSSSIKLYTNGLTNTPKGHCKNYHLYITSNEEIKEGDYGLIGKEVGKIILTEDGYEFLIGKGVSYEYGDYHSLQKVCKKIILTTDQDLIADGVQAIDDEFLEWFVKNPSCEFVEIRKYHSGILSDITEITSSLKIIIPQEEPKQETLEEYSNGLYKQSLKDDVDLTFSDGVKLGAKWQSERMYSEEELKNAIEISVAKALGVMSFTINEESFEQFKKKYHIK
jgi:hypothetical protein